MDVSVGGVYCCQGGRQFSEGRGEGEDLQGELLLHLKDLMRVRSLGEGEDGRKIRVLLVGGKASGEAWG
jgi:hypothetical protein